MVGEKDEWRVGGCASVGNSVSTAGGCMVKVGWGGEGGDAGGGGGGDRWW